MDGDAAVSRQVRAARIYPTKMAPAPGTRLEWFWWGLTAQIGKFAALDGDRQIEDHVRRIAEAVARGDRQLTRDLLVLAARTVGLGAGLPARFELLGAVGVTLAAIADSSLDAYELVRSVRDVARSRRSLLDAELRRRGGDVFSVTRLKEAKAAADKDGRVLGLVSRVLPLLIAVEAAQFLDGTTVRLLRAAANEPQSTGLIVLMVDSDQPSGDAPDVPEETLGDWLSSEERKQRLTRIRGPVAGSGAD